MADDGPNAAADAAQDFDDLLRLAAHVCGTPTAAIDLIVDDRNWLKASLGLDFGGGDPGEAISSLGLAGGGPVTILDLAADPRTRHSVAVAAEVPLRFYAGVPLTVFDDRIIGMLCAVDRVPHPEGLSAAQNEMLEVLARRVVAQLQQRLETIRSAYDLNAARDDSEVSLSYALAREEEVEMLRAAGARQRAAQEAGGIGTFEVEIVTGTITVSAEFCAMYGLPVAPSFPVAVVEALVLPEDAARRSNPETRAKGSADQIAEYRIRRQSDGAIRWIRRGARFVHDEAGTLTHMIGTTRDNTVERLLNEEIAHRLKNTLSLVQAVATFSLRGVADRGPVEELDQRLSALSTAHELLIGQDRAAAPLMATARAVCGKLGIAGRVALSGPPVELGPQSTLSLAMLVHELATNAVKYGGLSVAGGSVSIAWTADADELTLEWVEDGGPPVGTPVTTGFGSRLIARGLGGGSAHVRYDEAGVRAAFTTRLSRLEA